MCFSENTHYYCLDLRFSNDSKPVKVKNITVFEISQIVDNHSFSPRPFIFIYIYIIIYKRIIN